MTRLKKLDYISIGGNIGLNVDEKDLAILAELRQNSRIPIREIAERVGMHPNTVFQRIARLEKLKIIRGYRADIDFDKLGYSYCAVVMMKAANRYVNVDNLWREINIPEIQTFYRITGESDWVATVRAKSQREFAAVIGNISSRGFVKTVSHIILGTERDPFAYNPFIKRHRK